MSSIRASRKARTRVREFIKRNEGWARYEELSESLLAYPMDAPQDVAAQAMLRICAEVPLENFEDIYPYLDHLSQRG